MASTSPLTLLRPQSAWTDFTTLPVTVTIEIGTPPTTFYVNEAMVRGCSMFFDKVLNIKWQEGQSRIVKLPECNSSSFAVYVNWIHFGRIFVDDGKKGKESNSCWQDLVETYILGDKLLDIDFKDALCDAAAEKTKIYEEGDFWIFGPTHRRLLYENAVSGTTLRRLLVRRLCSFHDCATIVEEEEPSAFLYDMVQELLRGPQPIATTEEFDEQVKACAFHEHASGGGNCYRNKRR